jgi:hypothetical protein
MAPCFNNLGPLEGIEGINTPIQKRCFEWGGDLGEEHLDGDLAILAASQIYK